MTKTIVWITLSGIFDFNCIYNQLNVAVNPITNIAI